MFSIIIVFAMYAFSMESEIQWKKKKIKILKKTFKRMISVALYECAYKLSNNEDEIDVNMREEIGKKTLIMCEQK